MPFGNGTKWWVNELDFSDSDQSSRDARFRSVLSDAAISEGILTFGHLFLLVIGRSGPELLLLNSIDQSCRQVQTPVQESSSGSQRLADLGPDVHHYVVKTDLDPSNEVSQWPLTNVGPDGCDG